MSETVVTYPINGCLVGAEQMLGKIREWLAVNPEQERYLSEYFRKGGLEVGTIPEQKTKASRVAAEINAFLAENGFTITIDELAKNEFAVASLIKILIQWVNEGKKATIEYRGQKFPAAALTDKACKTLVLAVPHDGNVRLVAQLPTKSMDTVFMTALGEIAPKGFDLVKLASDLTSAIDSQAARPMSGQYEGVIFPMVDLDLTYELGWLKGLRAQPEFTDPAEVTKAVQQSRLKMNHKGALAESAAVMVMRCLSVRMSQPLVIDEPFLFWIERPGLSQPLFTAYVTPEHWKDPGEIEGL